MEVRSWQGHSVWKRGHSAWKRGHGAWKLAGTTTKSQPVPKAQHFFELVLSHCLRIPKAGSQFWGGACISSALVRL